MGFLKAVFGLAVLVAFVWAGEAARRGGLPLPGAVTGLVLFAGLMLLAERRPGGLTAARRALTPISRRLITHMGLLFVPAGVGVMAEADLIRRAWVPLLAGLFGSTLAALAVTAWLMHRLGRRAAGTAS